MLVFTGVCAYQVFYVFRIISEHNVSFVDWCCILSIDVNVGKLVGVRIRDRV